MAPVPPIIPHPVLGRLCDLVCLPFQTSHFPNFFLKETQNSLGPEGGLLQKKTSFIKTTVANTSLGLCVPSAVASGSGSADAALGLATVTGPFNPVEERAGGEVAGPPFLGTYVVVGPLAKTRKQVNTCEKGKIALQTHGLQPR